MEAVDPSRLNVWQALSELFLDTQLTDTTIAYIARVVLESNYSPEEIQRILWGEVFPVLEVNLRCVAGEWAGWTDDWLLAYLCVCEDPVVEKASGPVADEISRCWKQVASLLPPGFA